MKKVIAIVAFCLLSVSLFAQISDVLSVEDAIALYNDEKKETIHGNRVIEVIKELVSKGINTTGDYYNNTPLMYAAMGGYREIVKSLIEVGAGLNIQNKSGRTALMLAAWNSHTEIVKALIEAGADLDVKTYYIGETALMDAACYGRIEIVKVLTEAGTSLNVQDEDGKTALILAAKYGQIEAVKILIEVDANLNVQDDDRYTALALAAHNMHTEVVKTLIEAGLDNSELVKLIHTGFSLTGLRFFLEIGTLLLIVIVIFVIMIKKLSNFIYKDS